MSGERILIDTSVWIDYFRGTTASVAEKVDRILDEDEIFIPKMVIAELTQGALSAKEITVIDGFMEAFHIIDRSDDTWAKAGRLAYDLKRKGKSVALSDCYLAVIAEAHRCGIFTLNRHFREIKNCLNISLL